MTYQIKGYYPKSTKNVSHSTPKQQIIQWRNGQKPWVDTSPKKTSRWPTDTWKNAPHHSSGKYKSKPHWATTLRLSEWLHQFAFPTAVQKRSSFSTSSPTSVVAWVVKVSHSDRCEVVSHCGFDLYFPDDDYCWAFFHVSVGHLDVFFGEVSIHVFCPFHHWIVFWVLSSINSL